MYHISSINAYQLVFAQVPKDGDCLLHSVLVGFPASVAYGARALRSQLIQYMASHSRALLSDVWMLVTGQGVGWKEYLHHQLKDTIWGGTLEIYALSLMWDCAITVVDTQGSLELRIRHSKSLRDADIVLVYDESAKHYSGAGILFNFSNTFQAYDA